jgi:predicted nucleotidyltransferase
MLDLEQRYLDMLLPILKRHLPGATVWAFGSRVKGTAKRFSDLDLAIEAGKRVDLRTLAVLEQDLADSDLPIKVDVIDLAAVKPSFRKLVGSKCVLLPVV